MRIKDFIKENIIDILISLLWMLVSIFKGGTFIKENYDIGLQSTYGYTISYHGQRIAFIGAYFIAFIIIFFTCKFLHNVIRK